MKIFKYQKGFQLLPEAHEDIQMPGRILILSRAKRRYSNNRKDSNFFQSQMIFKYQKGF
jgi:hypothetical protein